MSLKRLSWLGLLSALLIVTRIGMQALPNVQLVTNVVLLLAMEDRLMDAILVSLTTMLVTSFYLGFGLFTLFQILDYALLAVLYRYLYKFLPKRRPQVTKAILLASAGFSYGLVITLMECLSYFKLSYFPIRYASSLPFDLYHALGNFFLYVFILAGLEKYLYYDSPKVQNKTNSHKKRPL